MNPETVEKPFKTEDDFYVGYHKRPKKALRFFLKRTIAAIVAGIAVVALVLAAAQSRFADSRFEFGVTHTYRGTYLSVPYPMLATADGSYLLVGPGKHGLGSPAADGDAIELEGTLIERDGVKMLEADPAHLRVLAAGGNPIASHDLGEYTLTGEIVDTKCFFGVMNPGSGKVHRDCAAQCIRGGVPPGLLVHDAEDRGRVVLLSGLNGRPIGAELIDYVAERVTISGRLFRRGTVLVFEIEPQRIHHDGSE